MVTQKKKKKNKKSSEGEVIIPIGVFIGLSPKFLSILVFISNIYTDRTEKSKQCKGKQGPRRAAEKMKKNRSPAQTRLQEPSPSAATPAPPRLRPGSPLGRAAAAGDDAEGYLARSTAPPASRPSVSAKNGSCLFRFSKVVGY